MKYWTVPLLLAVLLTGGHSQSASPDSQARFLAGLASEGALLAPLEHDSTWQTHAAEFNKAWSRLDEKQLASIRGWTPLALGNDTSSRDPLFYMFSGPDFLYANTFFPNARTYVFCGLEPAGAIPDVGALPRGTLGASLANLRKSLNAVLSFSFFITKDMKNDLRASHLSGTLPVLYVFLARLGHSIRSVELTALDNNGDFSTDKSATPGVKIVFSRDRGPEQTLYYFSTDLSNWGIKTRPGFIKFCDRLGDGNCFVKAASYLMHMKEFSDVRDFLLTRSKTVVQDDSGIPLRFFALDQWDVLFLGNYPGPIKLFEKNYQPDLATAFKSSRPPALTFSFGYRWHPSESSVIVATSLKSVPKAVPVPN